MAAEEARVAALDPADAVIHVRDLRRAYGPPALPGVSRCVPP